MGEGFWEVEVGVYAARLGAAIMRQRGRLGWSQRLLARKSGVSHPYLSQIEHGRAWPSEEVLTKICNALTIDIDVLFFRDDVPDLESKMIQVNKLLEDVKKKVELIARDHQVPRKPKLLTPK